MPYQVRLTSIAEGDLSKIDVPAIRDFVLKQLDNLSEHPAALSRRSHFPYREKCQLFSFHYDHGAQRWEFNVLFPSDDSD